MNHALYEQRLSVYRDLDPTERAEVDRHLDECPDCAARLMEYRAIARALRTHSTPAADERLREAFSAAVARAREQDRHARTLRPFWRTTLALSNAAAWAGVVALVALLLFSLAITWQAMRRQTLPARIPPTIPAPGTDLGSSEWVLTALNGKPLLEGTHITLNFLGDGRASGFAGCNAYGFEYTVPAEGTIAVGLTSITAQLCREPAGVMEQERSYTEALRSATSYRLAGDRLEMRNAAGETILSFQKREPLAMDPADLVGSEWQLVSWDGHPPLAGSPITIAFGENEISGLAGCRGYTGTYEASGDHIRFPMLAMTEVEPQCSEALQQQEGEYTTCLSWTTHYRLEGERLELCTARGETLVYTHVVAYSDWAFGVTLRHPAHWKPVEGYEARYGGPDGFFSLSARKGELSIDEAVEMEAGHKLQPYGSKPTIEALTIQGQEARLILPSADQDETMEHMAALIVRYPQPVTIRGETWGYFTLYADQEHIHNLAATLAFLTSMDGGPVEGWTGRLFKYCSMAQFDDYFERDDSLNSIADATYDSSAWGWGRAIGPRYGVEGATEQIKAEIERLHCQPETPVRLWGRLETNTLDVDGWRIVVERLEVLAAPLTPTPWPGSAEEPIAGWEGRIIPCGEGNVEHSFVRADGARLAVMTEQAEVLEALRIAECEGYPVRIWGILHREADGSMRIVVERLER